MYIRVFTTTYDNDRMLERNIRTLLESDLTEHDYDIYVINNYGTLTIPDQPRVTVLDNNLRPDFSTGHLSRNWNQALMLGFEDLKDPACTYVVCTQNDAVFKPEWVKSLHQLHQEFDLVTFGAGDEFHSYTPQAVIRIGMWDERFCNLGFHVADQWLRALIYHRERSSINDQHHGRAWNPRANRIIDRVPVGWERKEPSHVVARRYNKFTRHLFSKKWRGLQPNAWNTAALHKWLPQGPALPEYVLYPYFEKDIDFSDKNYVIPHPTYFQEQ